MDREAEGETFSFSLNAAFDYLDQQLWPESEREDPGFAGMCACANLCERARPPARPPVHTHTHTHARMLYIPVQMAGRYMLC